MVARREAGVSLIEVTVFSSILLGLLAIVSTFLVQGKRYFRQTESYALSQREASLLVNGITADLYRATEEHLTLEPAQMFFLSSLTEDDDAPIEFDPVSADTLWQRWVCYQHLPQSEEAVRTTIALQSPTSQISTLPVPEFADFLEVLPPDRKVVGRGVESLRFIRVTSGLYRIETTTRFNRKASGAKNDLAAQVKLESQVRIWIAD